MIGTPLEAIPTPVRRRRPRRPRAQRGPHGRARPRRPGCACARTPRRTSAPRSRALQRAGRRRRASRSRRSARPRSSSPRGFDDLFVAFPAVGDGQGPAPAAARRQRAPRLRRRQRRGRAQLWRSRFARRGRTLDVLLKVDVGYGRVGVLPEHALEARDAHRRGPRPAAARRLHPRGPRLLAPRQDAPSTRSRPGGGRALAATRRRSCARAGCRSTRCRSARRRPRPSPMRAGGVTRVPARQLRVPRRLAGGARDLRHSRTAR